MAYKTSIYINDRSEEVLGSRDDNLRISTRLNAIVDRYGEMLSAARRDTLPLFSPTELEAIRTACKTWATTKERAAALLGGLEKRVEDAIYVGKLRAWAAEHPEDAGTFLGKVKGLHPIQQLVLIEWLEA